MKLFLQAYIAYLMTHELGHMVTLHITSLIIYHTLASPISIELNLSTSNGRTYSDTYQKLIDDKHWIALRINAWAGLVVELLVLSIISALAICVFWPFCFVTVGFMIYRCCHFIKTEDWQIVNHPEMWTYKPSTYTGKSTSCKLFNIVITRN